MHFSDSLLEFLPPATLLQPWGEAHGGCSEHPAPGRDGRMLGEKEGCPAVLRPLPTQSRGTNCEVFIAFSNFLGKITSTACSCNAQCDLNLCHRSLGSVPAAPGPGLPSLPTAPGLAPPRLPARWKGSVGGHTRGCFNGLGCAVTGGFGSDCGARIGSSLLHLGRLPLIQLHSVCNLYLYVLPRLN